MIIIINNDNEDDDDDDNYEDHRSAANYIIWQDDGDLRPSRKSCAEDIIAASTRSHRGKYENLPLQVYEKSPRRARESSRREHGKSSRQVKDGRAINRLFYRTVI